MNALNWPSFYIIAGKRDFSERVKCARGKMPGNCVRRRPRPISRSDGAVPDRRSVSGHQLLVYGRLCGPWLLFSRNSHITGRTKGKRAGFNNGPIPYSWLCAYICRPFRLDTGNELRSCAAITNPDRSPRSMASTMSACESTATRMCGNSLRTCLITCRWRHSLMAKYSASTAAWAHRSTV